MVLVASSDVSVISTVISGWWKGWSWDNRMGIILVWVGARRLLC